MSVSVATLLVAAAVVLTYELTYYRHEVPERLLIVGNALEGPLAASLQQGDAEAARTYLAGFASDEGVQAAELFDARGELFASFRPSPAGDAGSSHADDTAADPEIRRSLGASDAAARHRYVFSDGQVVVHTPIVGEGGATVGALRVASDMAEWRRELRRYLAWFCLLLAAGIGTSILLSRFLQRNVSQPLVELAQTMQQVRRDRDYSPRLAQPERADEIGLVVAGFNEMLEEVQQRDRLLAAHRDELEVKVGERTADLVVARKVAEDASRAKNAFLATTSHELRTPLNSIIGFSELVLEGAMGEVNAEQAKALAIVRRSADELYELVKDILDLSSIEAGNLVLHPEPIDVRRLLDEQNEALAVLALDRRVELRPVACEEGLVVNADPARLSQVIRALSSNAFKFTESGHVAIRAGAVDGVARIEVEDTGIGIPAEHHPLIFEPFHRVESKGGVPRPGTGLGLAICRRIVTAMGGEIGLSSVVGRGSRFWFTVPLA